VRILKDLVVQSADWESHAAPRRRGRQERGLRLLNAL